MAAATEVGVPVSAPVVVSKLIPAGADGEISNPSIAPPVELIVNPIAAVFALRVSEEKERVKVGAGTPISVMVSGSEVAGVNEVGVKVRVNSPVAPVMTRSVKVAIPATAATVVIPPSSPEPVAIDATTSTVELVTVLPLASMMRMTGWVVRGDPLGAPAG